jgi:L-ectoine synthase
MHFFDAAAAVGTSRDVRHRNYRTLRLLLAWGPSPVGPTDITLAPGIKDTYGYPDRAEIAYCISGAAVAVDLDNGIEQRIVPEPSGSPLLARASPLRRWSRPD